MKKILLKIRHFFYDEKVNENLNDTLENYKFENEIYVYKDNYICDNCNRPYCNSIPQSIKERIAIITIEKNISLLKLSKEELIKLNRDIERNNHIYKFKVLEIYQIASYFDLLIFSTSIK